MDIHRSEQFKKLVPRRFIQDAFHNGVRRAVSETSKDDISSKDRRRRIDREKGWLIAGPQYNKYSSLIGFGSKFKGEKNVSED